MKIRKGLSVVNQGSSLVAQLYQTVILEIVDNDIMILNSGGWRTNHTKNCINDLLPNGYHLYQKDFEWYLTTPNSGDMPFTDNMRISI